MYIEEDKRKFKFSLRFLLILILYSNVDTEVHQDDQIEYDHLENTFAKSQFVNSNIKLETDKKII